MKELKELNEKEKKILDFINSEIADRGYPPSVREICKAVGLKSTSTVHAYLEKLEKDGYIVKDATKPRALKVIGHKAPKPVYNHDDIYSRKELVDIPIIGKVTAGAPILAVENIEDTFPLPVNLIQNSDAYMLRVQGDSMIEAGILDRDLVLVKQQSTASNGDIVVALIGDEATVKTFYKEKTHFRLQPQNPIYDPIIVKDNLQILGKVIGVFRTFV